MWRVLSGCLVLIAAAGCDRVFGLDLPPPSDANAAVGDGGSARDGLVFPPDGSTACGPRPAFEAWQFAPATLVTDLPGGVIQQFAFHRAGAELRAIVIHDNVFYDIAPGGTSTRIAALDPPQYTTATSPRMSADGEVLWFGQSGVASGVFRASRASGWAKHRADLGFVDAEAIEPGSVGFYAGEARMVISVRNVGGSPTLHELSSADGITWTPLDTIRFAASGLGDRNPYLSPDGCFLLYTAAPGSAELRVAERDPDGTFAAAVKLAAPSTLTSSPSFPVMTPDADSLWFAFVSGSVVELYRGQP